jgi:hypothetical protein
MNHIDSLYTAAQARAKLGNMATSTFHRLVLAGRIRKVTPPDKKQGLYVKEDVDSLAQELRVAAATPGPGQSSTSQQPPKALVDWMLPSDLPSILALDMLVYDEQLIGSIPLYHAWWKKNPKTTVLAFAANDRSKVLAQACLLPLPEPVILSILRGERDEKSITGDEVETYDRTGEYVLYAESVITHPDYRQYLGAVMQKFADFWCDLAPDRKIRRIYAQAVSTDGRFLVQKLFFGPLYDLGDNAFVLDLRYPNPSRFVQRFQQCVAQREAEAIRTDHSTPDDAKSDANTDTRARTTMDTPAKGNRKNRTLAHTSERA